MTIAIGDRCRGRIGAFMDLLKVGHRDNPIPQCGPLLYGSQHHQARLGRL